MGSAKRIAGAGEEKAQKKARATVVESRLDVEAAKAFFVTNDIKVHLPEGKDVDITPMANFQHPRFAKRLVKYCEGKFPAPTPIQACCWPLIMQRTDMCGIAKTGSGKTLAFALPFLSMSRKGELQAFEQPAHTPRFVTLAPTRELAMQISEVCKDLSLALGGGEKEAYPVQCIYGGVPKNTQRYAIEKEGVDMMVATPGRLQDLVDEQSVDLSYVQYLVLDEADRMLDMGFIDAVKALIGVMPKAGERQTCMFSATWPSSVHHLATQFLKEPVHVGVGSMDEGLVANKAIRQEVEVIWDTKEKPRKLLQYLKKYYAANKKIIVFGLYKKETAWLETYLQEQGYDLTVALQGDMSQAARTAAITDFKANKRTPLIATDVASRGLDVQDVELVINYTFPLTIEDYVHRIGRTGRAGKKGLAVCFFCPESKGAQDEKCHAADLVKILTTAGQVDAERAVLVRDLSTGQLRLETKKQLFVPGPYEAIEREQPLIRLADHEAVIVKDKAGNLGVHYGHPSKATKERPRSFFLEPYSEVLALWWSRGMRRETRDLKIERFDTRPNYMWFEFDCRTSDNVELMLETTIFWEVTDLEKMVRRTGNLPGDIYNQARSQFIKKVAKVSLKEFMSSLHTISKDIFEHDQEFYTVRGTHIYSLEVTQYKCSEPRTSEVLQQIIEETTNRLNRLSQAESENEVNLFKVKGQIETEKSNVKLQELRQKNEESKAEAAGAAEADRVAAFMTGLGKEVPKLEDRISMWQVLRKKDALSVVSSGEGSLYYTPADVNLSIRTEGHH